METGKSAVDEYCQRFQTQEHKDEEFEAFEKRVDEISSLIADFSSTDKVKAGAAMRRAKLLLGDTGEGDREPTGAEVRNKVPSKESLSTGEGGKGSRECETVHGTNEAVPTVDGTNDTTLTVDGTKLRVKQNKTVINQKAFDRFYDTDPKGGTMTQDAFMRSVEVDAQRRADDRRERQRAAERHKRGGNLAFQRGEYESAWVQYDKAIEQVKDSPLLYTNRALTLLNLELYEQVLPDCEKALKLDQHNLKAHLYKARAFYGLGEEEKALQYVQEIKDTYPQHCQMIEDYEKKFLES